MTQNRELDDLLGAAREETSPETDARVLSAAEAKLRRPLWRPLAAAAVLIAVALAPLLWPQTTESRRVDVAEIPVKIFTLPDAGIYVADGDVEKVLAGATVNLDDVTNGLEDRAAVGFDNQARGYIRLEAANPAKGVFFNKNADGDFRGRTENLFDRRLMDSLHGRDDGPNAEEYDALADNAFHDPRHEPLSTFSIDVDTASMSNVRRFLNSGRLPPAGAVRIEELINYFSYDYPEPTGNQPFSVTMEIADCPWTPGHRIVHVGLQGKRMTAEEIPPRNLVFLLDVSGSMDTPAKLPLVKAAMTLLVAQLREEDRVAIVVYAGASGVVLEPTAGGNSQAILGALDRLKAGGSTNGGAGIRLAYDLAKKHFDKEKINRVILATDGDFNVGTTSRDELHTLIEERRKSGVFLTVLGVGTGNIKDSQMEMLADKGNGNYAYLDTIAEAKKVLVNEAGGTLVTIAKDVKIQVEFNPERVGSYRLIGYANRKLAAKDFNDDTKDAGEIGAGHSVTALYEITPPGVTGGGVDPLKYQSPTRRGDGRYAHEVLTVKLRHKEPDGEKSRLTEYPLADPGNRSFGSASRDFQFSAAVAAFGMLLRNSEHKGNASYGMVEELIHATLGEDPHGYRKEFLGLVTKAKNLTPEER